MLTVNGTALSTLGFTGTTRRIPRLGGERGDYQSVPGSVFPVRLGGQVPPGRIAVDGWVKGSSHADLISKLDAIAALLNTNADLVLRLVDYTDREWVGRLQDASVDELDPQAITDVARVSFEFATGPARAQADTTHAASSALALGTAPTPLRITITNGATNAITKVVVRVRDGGAAGTIKQELEWNGSVAVSDVLVIDAETFSVTNDGVNAIGGLTAASEFPVPDPREGDDYVEVAVTGGTGRVIEVRYRKRWLP